MKAQKLLSVIAISILFLNRVEASLHYVNLTSANPVIPYSSWDTAATSIQDAIDVTIDGDEVVVTNGVYNAGGRNDNFGAPFGNSLPNRVVITNSIWVHSVNGPEVTRIEGSQVSGTTNGLSAVRCLFIEQNLNARVSGFTLTNGGTFLYSQLANGSSDCRGGGVFCWEATAEWSPAIISNCVITGCSSGEYGGGVCGGNCIDCTISNNSAVFGGGAYVASLTNCLVAHNSANLVISSMPSGNMGGGTLDSRVFNCRVFDNFSGKLGGGVCSWAISSPSAMCVYSNNSAQNGAGTYGGGITNCTFLNNVGDGAYVGSLYNCVLKNSTGNAAYGSTLYNCTVTGNASGVSTATALNCIIYYNTTEYNTATLYNCCSRTATANSFSSRGNFTNAPEFLDQAGGDLHLRSDSPCINSGTNANVVTAIDFDGNSRIAGGLVDVGAFEYQAPASALPYLWLQKYGLPTDGSADHADSDGDGMDNWLEWRSRTDPTNSQSLLQMLPLTNSAPGLSVVWRSVSGVSSYFVQRSTNLNASAFVTIGSNLNGNVSGVSRFRDQSATNNGPYFYRVGIQ